VRAEIIARNYAETLLELARRQGGDAVNQFAAAMDALEALVSEPRVAEFLATPRVSADEKKRVLAAALEGRVPPLFQRFVMVVVDKRRQRVLGEIAGQYRRLVDEIAGRVRVQVAVSHAPDAALQEEVRRALEARLGKQVIPAFTVDAELLGGLVVRVGDEILDGSVRSRAQHLRRRLMEASLPKGGAPAPAAAGA